MSIVMMKFNHEQGLNKAQILPRTTVEYRNLTLKQKEEKIANKIQLIWFS